MRRCVLVLVVATCALVAAGTASAQLSASSQAKVGHLHVLSTVMISKRSGDFLGGWYNTAVSCSATRRLRVDVTIDWQGANHGVAFGSAVTGRRANCAEGGPNLGETVTAREAGVACHDGSWKPGRYDFVTRTKHLRSGVVSVAELTWTKRKPCPAVTSRGG